MIDDNQEVEGDSRRTFIKKGTLVVAGLTAGTGATATTATAVNGETAVLQGNDYYPDVDFDVLTRFDTGSRNNFFEYFDEEETLGDPSDWEVYVIRIDVGESEGELGHLLVDTDDDDLEVEPGDTGTMDEIGSFRNRERNLIETEVDL